MNKEESRRKKARGMPLRDSVLTSHLPESGLNHWLAIFEMFSAVLVRSLPSKKVYI